MVSFIFSFVFISSLAVCALASSHSCKSCCCCCFCLALYHCCLRIPRFLFVVFLSVSGALASRSSSHSFELIQNHIYLQSRASLQPVPSLAVKQDSAWCCPSDSTRRWRLAFVGQKEFIFTWIECSCNWSHRENEWMKTLLLLHNLWEEKIHKLYYEDLCLAMSYIFSKTYI
jgi:hypothetical protein